MGTTAEKPQETSAQSHAQNSENSEIATVRWAIGVVALFIVCVAMGVIFQRVVQAKKSNERARLIAKCLSDPSFNRELCAELISEEREARIRSQTFRGKASRKAPFQLSGSDDDLTPQPGR
jgi:hypothetical protein